MMVRPPLRPRAMGNRSELARPVNRYKPVAGQGADPESARKNSRAVRHGG